MGRAAREGPPSSVMLPVSVASPPTGRSNFHPLENTGLRGTWGLSRFRQTQTTRRWGWQDLVPAHPSSCFPGGSSE